MACDLLGYELCFACFAGLTFVAKALFRRVRGRPADCRRSQRFWAVGWSFVPKSVRKRSLIFV